MRLLATVTLNANQLRAHLLPLVELAEVSELVLVADEPAPPMPKVRSVVPSQRQRRMLGRAGSKLVTCTRLARELRPEWVLSWNVMPHGVNGFVAGRAAGARTAYHMIGGEVEWAGGGWRSDNSILGRLPRPLPPLERALLAVVRRTDAVCTMGTRGRAALIARGLEEARVHVTPPAVDVERFSPAAPDAPRAYDLVAVGELIPTKRVSDFLEIVARLRERRPALRAAVAGVGPLRAELVAEADRRGVGDAIDFLGLRADIQELYRSARVFVLTSRYEGLSVAMTEAMASGLPPVVSDVGELRDLVEDGRSGFVVGVGDVAAFVDRIGELLDDENRHAEVSAAARDAAVAHASVPKVAEIYRRILIG
ncbi:MAG TPA: glycosyltransferase family 4 protein [Gaiellaceae bacterium]|nr:glycosyltransferase family 4 protein [Gaiellaceae bacterium]